MKRARLNKIQIGLQCTPQYRYSSVYFYLLTQGCFPTFEPLWGHCVGRGRHKNVRWTLCH